MGNESEKIKVVSLYQTCSACPSQWEGKTADGDYIYVRYRWGRLTVGTAKSMPAAVFNCNVFDSSNVGDGLDGYLPYEELIEHTRALVEWPSPDKVTQGRGLEKEEETIEGTATEKEQR